MIEAMKENLESLGIPLGYRHLRDAVVPYITYYVEDTEITVPDMGGVATHEDSCVIELHTANKDTELEKALEGLFDWCDITKHEEYDYSECLFEITYRFKIRHKVKQGGEQNAET